MTYDLAVWEGEPPTTGDAAAATFRDLYKRYADADPTPPPTQRILDFVEGLLAKWPQAGDPAPWPTAPLNQAAGPLAYLQLVDEHAEEVTAFAASLAWAHGLVCFDPQRERLLTPLPDHAALDLLVQAGKSIQAIAKIRERFGCTLSDAVGIYDRRFRAIAERCRPPEHEPPAYVLTTGQGRTINNPSTAALHRVLIELAPTRWSASLTRRDGWFVRVGLGSPAGTRPGWYALERQDGREDARYRTILTDVQEVIAAFNGFAVDDPNWARRYTWQPHAI
ncbi:hypothetical protein [Rugosimonospora africana]|uniref:Uncharacterized protein n=1 Tax=Rugosimonospora africana TaxID=556532 RepID=A0A8J3VW25_9ACTN|nr:hypothetical protein [Rugosimonospora africana]GIH20278.1 hypothetical protein Raf01_84500 [Rugosimonospora africana]